MAGMSFGVLSEAASTDYAPSGARLALPDGNPIGPKQLISNTPSRFQRTGVHFKRSFNTAASRYPDIAIWARATRFAFST
jgi:hypothetical protein